MGDHLLHPGIHPMGRRLDFKTLNGRKVFYCLAPFERNRVSQISSNGREGGSPIPPNKIVCVPIMGLLIKNSGDENYLCLVYHFFCGIAIR